MPFFEHAYNIEINGGQFQSHTQAHNHFHGLGGLQILHASTLPDAAYNSSAPQSSQACLPGTREQYISDITNWVQTHSVTHPLDSYSVKPAHKLLWFNGPFGVGKSAIARTCAEALQKSSALGAAFFFSRPNKRDDPAKLFTTIAYQLATRLRPDSSPYGALLEEEIRRDPSIVTKALDVQLHELIVDPILQLLNQTELQYQPPVLIIIDGLDECSSIQSQSDIIRIISEVALEQPSLPLLWAVFSRPEPHIQRAVRESDALWWEIALPVSNDSQKDIEVYLRNNFRRIYQQYGLSYGDNGIWPSDPEIKMLVEKSAGLFVFAATIVRFFDDPMLPEREQQLHNLLYPNSGALASLKPVTGTIPPLSHLDAFYTAIMQRIPPQHLQHTLVVLQVLSSELLTCDMTLIKISSLLGFPVSTLHSAIYGLHSVLYSRTRTSEIQSGLADMPTEQTISFYHYSFVEFLRDPLRSGEFYVFQHSCMLHWVKRCLEILSEYSRGGLERIQIKASTTGYAQQVVAALKKSMLVEASCSLLASCARIADLSDHPRLVQELYSLDYHRIVDAIDAGKRHLALSLRETDLRDLMKQISRYIQGQPWSQRPPRLLRERLQAMNIITQQFHNIKHKFDVAMTTRSNSSESITSSSSDSYTAPRSSTSGPGTPSTPSRVLPTYELGQRGKVVYLFPEWSTSGMVTYHVCTNLEDLREPYILTDSDGSS
ncbi:hypothetical protein NP233_g3965 [Leucocoprinus birnbaumii]|uniref:Nephrocystin 3-like N-terminal domain-containing protein n=1 Tax=Leucocoprinus birnbaumii TaxID=56174 RepID=A0AAD5VX19_9AGAR|nr:hypothetical protein NP233_g3965 [Leucocoprinus birnbaumii]